MLRMDWVVDVTDFNRVPLSSVGTPTTLRP